VLASAWGDEALGVGLDFVELHSWPKEMHLQRAEWRSDLVVGCGEVEVRGEATLGQQHLDPFSEHQGSARGVLSRHDLPEEGASVLFAWKCERRKQIIGESFLV
jgi:hypothetical protein